MISPESLKGKVKNISKSKRLSSQEVLQMFFFLKDNSYIKELDFFDTVEVVNIIAEKIEI